LPVKSQEKSVPWRRRSIPKEEIRSKAPLLRDQSKPTYYKEAVWATKKNRPKMSHRLSICRENEKGHQYRIRVISYRKPTATRCGNSQYDHKNQNSMPRSDFAPLSFNADDNSTEKWDYDH
jgi:hypothetical protein